MITPPMEIDVYVCDDYDGIGCGWIDLVSNYPEGMKVCPFCGEKLCVEIRYI